MPGANCPIAFDQSAHLRLVDLDTRFGKPLRATRPMHVVGPPIEGDALLKHAVHQT